MNEAKPLLSIGMIFRDDIRCLERCLKSLQPLRDEVPCELIMADTGSVDGSREVAERYADLLIDFPWVDDFSAARNAVLEHCTGTWFLAFDSDMWVEDVQPLVTFLREPAEDKKDLILVTGINYASIVDKTSYSVMTAACLAKLRGGLLRYRGKIHESLHYNGHPLVAEHRMDIEFHHDGYAYSSNEAKRAKSERNMALLRETVRDHPYDLRTLIECMQSAYDPVERMKYAKRTIRALGDRRTKEDVRRSGAYQNAADVAFGQKEYNLLFEWVEKGLEEFPHSLLLRLDGCYYVLHAKVERADFAGAVRYGKMWREALQEYRALQDTPDELTFGWLNCATEFHINNANLLLTLSAIQVEDLKLVQELLNEQTEQRPPENSDLLRKLTEAILKHAGQVDGKAYLQAQWDRALEGLESKGKEEAEFAGRCADMILSAVGAVLQTDQRTGALETLASLGDRDPARSARIMLSEDPEVMRRELAGIRKWEHVLFPAVLHIMEHGVPLTENFFQMSSELMLRGVIRISNTTAHFAEVVLNYIKAEDVESSLPRRLWALDLAAAAIQKGDWDSEKEEDTAVCSLFASAEAGYLRFLYRLDALNECDLPALPSIHRFGWRLLRGIEALRQGDELEYVRLIREGVKDAPNMVNAASVLCGHLDMFSTAAAPNPELLALAKQVKAILARYDPDDPAVAELKASPAYRNVAHLLGEAIQP